MIRRSDRVEKLKLKLDSFKGFESDFRSKELFVEAMDNIECEINVQLEKFISS